MLKATLVNIGSVKKSQTESYYRRLIFRLENNKTAKTDLVSEYDNYKNWIPVLQRGIGTEIDNLILRREGEIDADSKPKIIENKTNQQKLL